MALRLELETKKLFADELPRALFISSAIHTTIRLGLMDLQLAVLTQDIAHFRNEFGYMCRVLDNYMILQFQGYYKVLDLKFNNVIDRSDLRGYVTKEMDIRQVIMTDLAKEFVNPDLVKQWKQIIVAFLDAEDDILYPFEVRLRPEVSVKMLVNAGNDWEYMVRFIYAKLEQHHLVNLMLSFSLDLHNVLKISTPLESQRIVPIIMQSLSAEAMAKLEVSIPGFTQGYEQLGAGATAAASGTPTNVTPRFRSPREMSVKNILRSPSGSKAL
mmetsp:Transcript_3507/g.6237  ORF Transcript_3507/g.6237 Transcript_3507/m.6237 type:complete len:271 (-) Transcript_3507:144-956(-)|eukprot:CAMPEP_0184694128 /NCGR_PEP_ID=MMETSP0313-20130426/2181_1 /TAXON_ID=2792 /ORGANISM="Porphyridium aerugineum, Strain SAG 1380-2" /LENGTH=270 /DNA_ID=CAMNT_0027152363 /DNA_START=150 /DNA_END=962 /DNA_ORIENTATION=+